VCFGVVRPWQYSVVSKFGFALTSNSLGLYHGYAQSYYVVLWSL